MEAQAVRNLIASRLQFEGLNLNQDVRQYKDVQAKKLVPYRVRRVVSPYEFYLELTNFPEPRLYRNWFPKMQEFYENRNNQEKMKLFKETPIPGRCYVCKDFNDGQWHRVRLHSVKKPLNDLIVFYLDLCKLQRTKPKNLLELSPEFAEAPAQVFLCYLADLSPVGTPADTIWSLTACTFFQNIVKDKEFLGITLYRSDHRITENMPDFITTLGVVLVESQPGTRIPKPEVCTLNAQMVDAGFATATGVCAGCKHPFEIKNSIPFFDQMEFDALYPSDTKKESASEFEEPGAVAILPPTLEVAEKDTTEETKFEAEVEKREDYYYKNTTNTLPVGIANKLASIDVVYVVSSSHIITQLKSKKANLKQMQEKIRKMVEENDPLANGKSGMLVACNVLDFTDQKNETSIWCRGIISKVFKKETGKAYKVFLVDYGNVVEVQPIFVRPLPSYFEKIPSFAIRVHLDVEHLVPVVGPEVSDAEVVRDFRTYLQAWVDCDPIYFMYHSNHAGKLELTHYDQKILYNKEEHKWFVPEENKAPSPVYKFVDQLKDHPMVCNLFVSVGVELVYEVFVKDHHFWYFKSISGFLEGNGYAKSDRTTKTKTRLHCDIVDAANSSQVELRSVELPGNLLL